MVGDNGKPSSLVTSKTLKKRARKLGLLEKSFKDSTSAGSRLEFRIASIPNPLKRDEMD
jgi:hypothetical protein